MQNKIESVQMSTQTTEEDPADRAAESNVGVGGNQRKWAVAIIKLDL